MLMRRYFLAEYPLIGTKHKPSPTYLQQRSPYYWWWAYLRRNIDYLDCCENGGNGRLAWLYADFGDVRSDDFRTWWGGKTNRGAELFAEKRLDFAVLKLEEPDDWIEELKTENVLVVAFNKDLGRRQLQSRFAALLQKEVASKRGRPVMGSGISTARYPLHRNFTVHNLKTMLAVYDAWHQNQQQPRSQQRAQWQLGNDIKLVQNAISKDKDIDATNKRAIMTAAFGRSLAAAKRIITNTANGQFPNSTS
jgi:hypothetical protein